MRSGIHPRQRPPSLGILLAVRRHPLKRIEIRGWRFNRFVYSHTVTQDAEIGSFVYGSANGPEVGDLDLFFGG